MASVDQGYFVRRGPHSRLTPIGDKELGPPSTRTTSAYDSRVGDRDRESRNFVTRPVRGYTSTPPGAVTFFKLRGRIGEGGYATWVSTVGPLDPPPGGGVVTEVSFVKLRTDSDE